MGLLHALQQHIHPVQRFNQLTLNEHSQENCYPMTHSSGSLDHADRVVYALLHLNENLLECKELEMLPAHRNRPWKYTFDGVCMPASTLRFIAC